MKAALAIFTLGMAFLYACADGSIHSSSGPTESKDVVSTDGKANMVTSSISQNSDSSNVADDAESDFRYFQRVFEDPEQADEQRYLALKKLESAAAKGHIEAQLQLGFMLNTGTVLPENSDAAVYWLLLAAQQGNIEAQRLLGAEFVLRSRNQDGDEYKQSVRNAEHWLREGADAGDIESKSLLAKILVQREETRDEGLRLLAEAAGAGSNSAKDALELIEEQLGSEE